MSSTSNQFVNMGQDWFTTKLESTVNMELLDLFKFVGDHVMNNFHMSDNSINRDIDIQRLYFVIPIDKHAVQIKNAIVVSTYSFYVDWNTYQHDVDFLKLVEYLSMHYLHAFTATSNIFEMVNRFPQRADQDFNKLWQRMPNDKIADHVLVALNYAIFWYYFKQFQKTVKITAVDLRSAEYNESYRKRYIEFETTYSNCVSNITDYDNLGFHNPAYWDDEYSRYDNDEGESITVDLLSNDVKNML